jgi:hypothetical protein
MPETWECNPTNTLINLKMWGLDQLSEWQIGNVEFAQNGANAI